jgi:hypothetical protein
MAPPIYPLNQLPFVLPLSQPSATIARYFATAGELVRADTTSNAVRVLLPYGADSGNVVTVKLVAGTNGLTVAAQGGDIINSGTTTTYTISGIDDARTFVSNGSGTWTATAATYTRRYDFMPSDQGFAGWSFDPALAVASTAVPTAGTLYVARVKCPTPFTATNVHLYVETAGGTLTASQCLAGLYSSAGAKLGVTGALSSGTASFATQYAHQFPLTAPVTGLAAGDYYVAAMFNGTTGPALAHATKLAATLPNVGLAAPNFRAATADTGLTTTLPATLGTQTASIYAWWAAIS